MPLSLSESCTAYAGTVLSLVEYELWCNLQAVDFLDGLTDEECRRDFGFGLRTPHRTMFHIANVMRTWSHCVGPVIRMPAPLPYDEAMPLQDIRTVFVELGAFLLAEARASHERGELAQNGRLTHVLHLVTHGTHHRGQLLSMITLMGHGQPFEGGDFGGWWNAAV